MEPTSGVQGNQFQPGDEAEGPKQRSEPVSRFDSGANVSAGNPEKNAAGQVRRMSAENVEECPFAKYGKIDPKKWDAEARQRVGMGVYRQEQNMLDAVNTFAGSDRTLRRATADVLLAP